MSAEENKAVVRRIYEKLWDERRLDVADELIAEDAVTYATGLVPLPFGPEEMKGTVRMVTASFPDNRHEVEDLFAEGDQVMARIRLTGTPRAPLWAYRPREGGSRSPRSTSTACGTGRPSSTGQAGTTSARCASWA